MAEHVTTEQQQSPADATTKPAASGLGITKSSKKVGKAGKRPRAGKKQRRHVTDGIVHIYMSFNNSIVTISDRKGNTLSWATAGGSGFRGSRKSTAHAAQVAVQEAAQKAKDFYGLQSVEVRVRGPGPARDSALRMVASFFSVSAIVDRTATPFNGCRACGERRV